MSQSKMDTTRSGSSGANWQLSSLRSLWTMDRRAGADGARPGARGSVHLGRRSSGRASAQRLAQPSSWRSTKPSGGRGRQAARGGIEGVEIGHRLDEREREPAAGLGMRAQGGGQRVAHHLAAAALHHEEVGAEHRRVVAEEIPARRAVEVRPEPREHLELALHVVGAGRDLAERRPAQHQLVRAHPEEIREVGRAVGELEHLERPARGREAPRRGGGASQASSAAQSSCSPGRTGATSAGASTADAGDRVRRTPP